MALRHALEVDSEVYEVYNVNDPTNACEWFDIAEMWYRLFV